MKLVCTSLGRKVPLPSVVAGVMIERSAVIAATWLELTGSASPLFHGATVAAVVNCALAVRTALLS